MLMHIFNVGVGMTFSGGLIDLFLFGILQGNAKTNWIWIVVVGLAYAVIYYFIFYFLIKKFNFRTPGREDDGEETKLYTRADVEERKKGNNSDVDVTSALILKGLGGTGNISDIDCCATRLRITVKKPEKISDNLLRQSGASGVIRKGNGVQVIYGPQVSVVKSHLEDYIDKHGDADIGDIQPSVAQTKKTVKGQGGGLTLLAHASGEIVALENVDDEVFSKKILGEGIAIEPSDGKIFAPCDAVVESVFDTNHAVNIVSDKGHEILIHIGIDTVKLKGNCFKAQVKDGQRVHKGELLVTFDIQKIKAAGYKVTTPMIICNEESYSSLTPLKSGRVKATDEILRLD